MCGKCRKWVCRAFFPEKQPYISENMRPICSGNDYERECLVYGEAQRWREERRRQRLAEQCPFASNAECGKPWRWMCKGGTPPFFLTEVEQDQYGHIPRGPDGGYIWKQGKSVADIRDTCLSGRVEVYEGCPHYKEGVAFREYVASIKKGENP